MPSAVEARWRAAVSASRSFRISQARSAAVPFKSVLAEAAVGEVLLFFSVDVGMTRTASSGSANAVGDDLADLGVEPLAHLGAAGRDLDRAVAVDVDERTGLVERPPRERDPELDRRQRDPAQVRPRGCVEPGDLVAAPRVIGRLGQPVDQERQRVVGDDLAVGRGVAARRRRSSSCRRTTSASMPR